LPSSNDHKYRGTDYILGTLTLILGSLLLFWAASYLQPVRLPPASPGSYHYITRLDDLAPGTAITFDLENRPWLLVRTRGGDITAVSGYCTYRGTRIQWDPANGIFLCQGHGSTFGPRGHLIDGLATAPLETLKIRIVDGRIYGARSRS
jgi:Rieske Fe-S protein